MGFSNVSSLEFVTTFKERTPPVEDIPVLGGGDKPTSSTLKPNARPVLKAVKGRPRPIMDTSNELISPAKKLRADQQNINDDIAAHHLGIDFACLIFFKLFIFIQSFAKILAATKYQYIGCIMGY